MIKKNKVLLIILGVLTVALVASFLVKPQNNDTAQITEVLQKEVPAKSAVKSFEVVSLNVKDGFAKATIKPLDVDTDNAMVILQKKNAGWEIIWGPGTALIEGDPILKILPKNL